MGDELDVMDEKDGVRDGYQISVSCDVEASGIHHRAKQSCKRKKYGK